ncbi:hypothetical protein RKD28_001574 [Streptomyces sp. SAI-229]
MPGHWEALPEYTNAVPSRSPVRTTAPRAGSAAVSRSSSRAASRGPVARTAARCGCAVRRTVLVWARS